MHINYWLFFQIVLFILIPLSIISTMIASSLTKKFNMNKKKMFLIICSVVLIYTIAHVLFDYYELTENFWECTLTVYLPYRIKTDENNQTFTQLKRPTNFSHPHFKEVDQSLFDKLFLENEDSRDIWDTLGKSSVMFGFLKVQ